MDMVRVSRAFNRWMDEFTNNPSSFQRTEDLAILHLREMLDGREPTYGERCAAVLAEYMGSDSVSE